MNTMTTLFGGLVAVFALYAAGGLIKTLPPLLRAVLAGLIPLLAYFAMIIGQWPGLDVVSIHISVFLAAGLVLHAWSQFRRRGSRMHWVPKLLFAFFMGLVVLNGTLLYISTKGLPEPVARWWLGSDGGRVYSGFSGVVSHDQSAAKAVSSELSESHRESQMGWKVDIFGLLGDDAVKNVQVRVMDRTGLPVERITAELKLLRPGAATATMVLSLKEQAPGLYEGTLSLPSSGRWLVDVRLLQNGEMHFHNIRELVAS